MLIKPYTEEWKHQFEKIKGVLYPTIATHILGMEHVGSTSVPGLAAKAIIDIDIVFDSYVHFPSLTSALEKLGYYHNGDQGIPQREAFKRKKEEKHPVLDLIDHHLYACPKNSPELDRHLRFRDYLRSHPEACRAYEQIKYRIAEETGQDKKAYSLLKEEAARAFIEGVLRQTK